MSKKIVSNVSNVSTKTKSRAEYQKLRRQKIKLNGVNQTFKFSKERDDALAKIDDEDDDDLSQQQVPTMPPLGVFQPPTINNDNNDDGDNNDVDLTAAYEQYQTENNNMINEGVKSLQTPDYINDLTEYFETSKIVEELKDTQLQLKNTQALLNKTNELVAILNSELVDKHKQIKQLVVY